MNEATPIVVFDFDLTLTRWDTADLFFRWLLKRDAWRLALVLSSLPVLGPLLLLRVTRKWPIRFAVWVATLGRTPIDLDQLVREHADEVLARDPSLFLPAAVQQLRAHVAQGHRVVIATGCLEPLARELLVRQGLGAVPLVASTLRPFLGGMARQHHCFGANKVPMLAARGFAPPWAFAYTDHQCDLPVLELSRDCFLVNPKPKCLGRIEQVLKVKPVILAWR
jgi:phosphatidylglycerophosphatase C